MRISDWSSDVCSSDLQRPGALRCQFPLEMDDALSQRHGIRPEAPLDKHDPAITDQHHAAATRPIARITHERRRQHPFQPEPDDGDRKSTRLNSSNSSASRMPASASNKKKRTNTMYS